MPKTKWPPGRKVRRRIKVKSGTATIEPAVYAPCPYLGPAIERAGVTVRVKCGCNGREHDKPHAAHKCELYGRCLPALVPADLSAWQARKPESDIYHLCRGCDRGISTGGQK